MIIVIRLRRREWIESRTFQQKTKRKTEAFDRPVFGIVGFEMILGTIIDVILEFKIAP